MVICTAKFKKWTSFSIVLLIIVFGILIVFLWSSIFQFILKKELSIENENTKGFKMWKETPLPMYLEFYLYNWTNFNEYIANSSIKPEFQQCGPYVYEELHIRENITYNKNSTVTYLTKRIWTFLPEKTNGSLQDVITTLNPIVATIGSSVKHLSTFKKFFINLLLEEKKINLTVTKTADEFIFKGYDDPLLDLVKKLNINLPYDKFGWFYGRNESATYDGVFNMETGGDDIENLGIIRNWNYADKVNIYSGNCSNVMGTTGELWYPPRGRETVHLFTSDLCSSVELNRGEDIIFNGITGNKYKGTEKMFDNGTKFKDMKCYVDEGDFQPSGVRNVSKCKFGAPALLSFPHFYLADQYYRDAIIGMEPNKSIHEMFISLEPTTGLPLQVRAAFQLNLMMEQVSGISILKNVKTTLMPALWFRQTAEMTKALTDQAKLLLVLPSAGTYTGYGIIALGVLIAFIVGFITYKKAWRQNDEECLLSQNAL